MINLITSRRLDEGVALALEHPVRWVRDQLSYDEVDGAAEQVSDFVQRWLPELTPLERLEAADWAAGQYMLAMVHLDHAYGIGARLLLEAQQAAAAALAASFRDFWALTDGPDAETSPEVAVRLRRYADQLDEMTF